MKRVAIVVALVILGLTGFAGAKGGITNNPNNVCGALPATTPGGAEGLGGLFQMFRSEMGLNPPEALAPWTVGELFQSCIQP
jgi:hypothetical protein